MFKNKQGTEREKTLRHNTWKPCKWGQRGDREFFFKSNLSHVRLEQGLGKYPRELGTSRLTLEILHVQFRLLV